MAFPVSGVQWIRSRSVWKEGLGRRGMWCRVFLISSLSTLIFRWIVNGRSSEKEIRGMWTWAYGKVSRAVLRSRVVRRCRMSELP